MIITIVIGASYERKDALKGAVAAVESKLGDHVLPHGLFVNNLTGASRTAHEVVLNSKVNSKKELIKSLPHYLHALICLVFRPAKMNCVAQRVKNDLNCSENW
jgi:hypothetical protein